MAQGTAVTEIDDREDWVQEVSVILGGANGGEEVITPNNGTVRISYEDQNGNTHWWNGSKFVQQSTPIKLSTTIDGVKSVYQFTVPQGIEDVDLLFEGWINGDKLTYDSELVRVAPIGGKSSGVTFDFD